MSDSANPEVAPSPPPITKVTQATQQSTKKASKSTDKRKRAKNKATLDANGFPKSLTPEQSTWLDAFNEEYLSTSNRKAFFDRTVKSFCDEFSSCLIENSPKLTRDKVTRHFYNLNNANTDGQASKKESSINKSSIFTFEKKLKKTTALALFTEENREHICDRIAEEREAEDLPTTQNPRLYNQIRSAEYNGLSEDDKEVWVETAANVNELRAAALEMPAEEEIIAKNQAELKAVLQQSLERLIGNGHNQIGTKVRFRLRTYLEDTDGQVHSFEINLGKDAAGKHFHETEMFKNEKPNDWKEWAAYSLASESSEQSLTSDSQQASASSANESSEIEEEEQPCRPPKNSATSRLVIDDDDNDADPQSPIIIHDDDDGNNKSDTSRNNSSLGTSFRLPEQPGFSEHPATPLQTNSANVPSRDPSAPVEVDPKSLEASNGGVDTPGCRQDDAAGVVSGVPSTPENNNTSFARRSPLEQGAATEFNPASVEITLPPTSETPVNEGQLNVDPIAPEIEEPIVPVTTPANDRGQSLPPVLDSPSNPPNEGASTPSTETERVNDVESTKKKNTSTRNKRKATSCQADEDAPLPARVTRATAKIIEAESTRKSKRTRRR
ncbi:hypothetical protein SCHPADRAFT_947563 [Schizopora paradoxa]|uniref:Uncharacterized protein n=1 Tax=Schizopora paradoxa TaxID=27342 RepID=A0A0H2QYI3_9AGAM|nr:hypothetical protein SCHPADRAFT_947563 [Schizopora paradoxa]